MRFAQLTLAVLAGIEGALAHSGHEPVVQPLYPERREPMRAQPLLPELNDNIGLTARGLLKASVDGSCGISSTCEGSQFGTCCSRDGWCGSSAAFCGAGCREGYGLCDSPEDLKARQVEQETECEAPSASATTATSSTSTAATAQQTTAPVQPVTTTAPVQPVTTTTAPTTPTSPPITPSKNGKCGASSNQSCASILAPCCSRSGQCGWSCFKIIGCQTKYGWCM